MTTTIQVDERTLKVLAALKHQLKARSYQEVLEVLVSERRKVPRSLLGLAKGSKPYAHESETEHIL